MYFSCPACSHSFQTSLILLTHTVFRRTLHRFDICFRRHRYNCVLYSCCRLLHNKTKSIFRFQLSSIHYIQSHFFHTPFIMLYDMSLILHTPTQFFHQVCITSIQRFIFTLTPIKLFKWKSIYRKYRKFKAVTIRKKL